MNTSIDEVEINGVKYIRKDTAQAILPLSKDIVLVRCKSAGVFFGHLVQSDLGNGGVVILRNARRVWYWSGAASLSQLAVDGTTKPSECKFPTAVSEITLTECIEIIPCTEKAISSLNSVAIWKQ